ncbi:hypothetical protein NLI96_g5728 [Meripilus lineatus]|uniref:DUF6534 domain-containing protein n=1 Tax=Meripilus lineatus TaxID=2056292 RepID=A0AAD5YIT3_9APHY|nr:hypothetical protein NLI96_g5728 [Physisporinus lineatus]
MASPRDLTLSLNLDTTLGAVYIGNIAASVLFGLTSFQTIAYFNRYPNDKNVTKILVMILWVLDFLHFFMITHAFYYYGVTNYMNPTAMGDMIWSLVAHVIVEAFSDVIVRGIFAYRIWKLSEGNVPLVFTIVIGTVAVFSFAVRAAQILHWVDFEQISSLIYYTLSTAAAADIIMSASLCYFLRRRRSAFKGTQSLINTLVVYSINSGALTSVCALACVICYAAMPRNFIFQAFYYVLPKLLLNSLLAMMNARPSIRDANALNSYNIPLNEVTQANG